MVVKLVIFIFVVNIFVIDLNLVQSNEIENSNLRWSRPLRYKRQSPCGTTKYQCRSGTCISMHQKCDGVKDCPDGSDETSTLCGGIDCPSYAFRCSYGACVDGDAACNNKQECADNSDELRPECPTTAPVVVTPKRCRANQFECGNGNCIRRTSVCDGANDCKDGSDETWDLCKDSECPSSTYKCDYGACVDGDALCNRIIDCIDLSDEKEVVCGRPPPPTPTTMVVTQPPNEPVIPTPQPTPMTPVAGEGSCMLPEFPDFGSYIVLGTSTTISPIPNTPVAQFQVLQFKCRLNYVIKGEQTIFCIGGQWSPAPPQCLRPCKPLQSATLEISCYFDNKPVACNKPMSPGTRADLECKKNYRVAYVPTESIVCGEDGTWDYSLYRCTPECGTLAGNATAYVIGGEVAKVGEIPWQAAIYEKIADKTPAQICGGSLVNSQTVISAAHCFWTPGATVPKDKDRFAVGLGKVHRTWMDERDVYAIYSDVRRLVLPPAYMDIQGNYAQDIAIVFLTETIEFTAIIKPVCVEWGHKGSVYEMAPGTEGKVAGWGLTSEGGDASPELKQITLPSVPRYQCIEHSPQDFQQFLTADKFCAGYLNGSSVCKGDSGGGLSFPTEERGKNVYYLRGIVSVGPTREHSCNSQKYTAFTTVLEHLNFLKEYEVHTGP